MGTHEKLLARFLSQPKDFTWDELTTLLRKYGYKQSNKGKTSGSRVVFDSETISASLDLHKPHPKPILHLYQMKVVLDFLKRTGILESSQNVK
jgi:hypothetical protein